MTMRNKDIDYIQVIEFSDKSGTYPLKMPAVVLADVGNERLLIINTEGDVKVIKKWEARIVA